MSFVLQPRVFIYSRPSTIENDQDVLTFIGDVKGYNVIDVYVEHLIEIPDYVELDEVNVQFDKVNMDNVQATNLVNVQVDKVNVEDVQATEVNVEVVQANEVNMEDVQAGEVNVEEDESETNPDYEASEENEDECDTDLGPDVNVAWTTMLAKDQTQQCSSYNVISDNESFDLDELQTPPESDIEDEMEEVSNF
ncbi:unnamed protein product [Vicia faba]|uniref:Uncharacterized protein n=1 Tax=Vicia faba TaxID=3906 RepID=A0AAV0ZA55_VICFA|nr:unnamed protein product [Vicia faba]